MCGIVGMISTSFGGFQLKDITLFNQLLTCNSVRGEDSTGVFGVDKLGNAEYLKTKGNPFELIKSNEYNDFSERIFKDFKFVIGHNRKATIGSITDETAHPFQEGNIVLVHNGTLLNHTNLTNETVLVDSHAITHAIVTKGYKQTLKELQGAFTLVWYDATDKCLRFVRNDKRPLHLLQTNSNIYLSSELELVEWIISRETITTPTIKVCSITPGYVYSINLDKPDTLDTEQVDFYEPPPINFKEIPEPKKVNGVTYKNSGNGPKLRNGDTIVVTPVSIIAGTSNNRTILKATSLFKGQPSIYIFLTKEEEELYDEIETPQITCTITRIIYDHEGNPTRLYGKDITPYKPIIDASGQEVFLEEWKSLVTHKCKKCNSPTYWKDIHKNIFRYKPNGIHRIICSNCISKGKTT